MTAAHNFAHGDPDVVKAQAATIPALNVSMPMGTIVESPTVASLARAVNNALEVLKECRKNVAKWKASSNAMRLAAAVQDESKANAAVLRLRNLNIQVGTLSRIYELKENGPGKMFWDYCLIELHPGKESVNVVNGHKIRSVESFPTMSEILSSDVDIPLSMAGSVSRTNTGTFFHTLGVFRNHPRFPSKEFESHCVVSPRGPFVVKGNSGGPVAMGATKAVAIICGTVDIEVDTSGASTTGSAVKKIKVCFTIVAELSKILDNIKAKYGWDLELTI